MTELDRALTEVFAELGDEAPHDVGLALRVRRRARRRGVLVASGAVVAASALVVGGVALTRPHHEAVQVATVPAAACDGTPKTAVLPAWARTGFSDPEPVATFVPSRSGDVVAILFGGGLWAPPRSDVNNKVLWVWRESPGGATGDVRMSAHLAGTDRVVTAGLPRPEGPSYVDLPAPGCWHVTLTSPRGTDTIDLEYRTP